ncbi:hypothetical protein [Shewanella algae]|uniref:hypothetical protein n=1 Tax=Shewanella algae TaxID=38313 RepID=UPI0031F512EE
MSESVIARWQALGRRLQQQAAAEDWQGVCRVNRQMIQLLRQQGKPRSQAELQARKQLELCHSQVMQLLQTKRESLQRQMQQLLAQQEGISAYQLTQLSQPEFQEGNMSKGDLY